MTWFELIGAFLGNLHMMAGTLGLIMAIFTLLALVGAAVTAQEYNEIEFISLFKSFGTMTIFLGLLFCAPTPGSMQNFAEEVDALHAKTVSKEPPTEKNITLKVIDEATKGIFK